MMESIISIITVIYVSGFVSILFNWKSIPFLKEATQWQIIISLIFWPIAWPFLFR